MEAATVSNKVELTTNIRCDDCCHPSVNIHLVTSIWQYSSGNIHLAISFWQYPDDNELELPQSTLDQDLSLRKVAEYEEKEIAQQFRWFLASKGISVQLDKDDDLTTVWVENNEELNQARKLKDFFDQNHDHIEIQSLCEQTEKEFQGKRKAIREKEQRERREKKAASLKSNFIASYPVTMTFLISSIIIYFFNSSDKYNKLYTFLSFSGSKLSYFLGGAFGAIEAGQVWRLVTPIFIHNGIFHILFNMMWLYHLGRLVEQMTSTFRAILLVIFISVISHIGFVLVAGPHFGGMSGVIYGFFGYIWIYDYYRSGYRVQVDPQWAGFFFIWYIICLGLTLVGMGVANTIHGLGAFAGMTFAYLESGHYKQLKNQLKFNTDFRKKALIGLALLFLGMLIDYFTS